MEEILLLEPNYKNKYPPLGLMKISAYHKDLGDKVTFSKGKLNTELKKIKYDKIYITTLFTFEWDKTIELIMYAKKIATCDTDVFVGGIAATLMPERIEEETGIRPIIRRLDKCNSEAMERIGYDSNHVIDDYTPDYNILNQVKYEYSYSNSYFAFMTRGCGMHCEFCAVDKLEPEFSPYISIKKQIEDINKKYGEKKDLKLMDNNVLVSPKFNEIIKEIKELGFFKGNNKGYVDFNQGLDANILANNEKKAKLLGEVAIKPARIAFDHIEDKDIYIKAIKNCVKHGIKRFSNYMLYNADAFKGKGKEYKADAPEDLYKRIKITLGLQSEINQTIDEDDEIRIYSFPMKYIPLKSTDRKYISEPNWNKKYLRAIQIMLLPLRGVGGVSEEFFRKSFGENIEQFKLNIKMPESILMSRGKFLRRDDEKIEDWKNRINEDKVTFRRYMFYEEWKRLHKKIVDNNMENELIEIIKDNSFRHKKYFGINNDLVKIMFLHYLSLNQILLLFNKLVFEGYKHDIKIISDYIYNEFKPFYENIVDYIYNVEMSSKKLYGIFKILPEKIFESIINKWIENDLKNDFIIDSMDQILSSNEKKHDLLLSCKVIKRFISAGVLSDKEINLAKEYIIDFKIEKLRDLLNDNKDDFIEKLELKNENEICYDKIEKEIMVLDTELNKKISLF